MRLYALAFAAGLFTPFLPRGAAAQSDVTGPPEVQAESPDILRRHLRAAVRDGDCKSAAAHAHELLTRDRDDLESLHAIADCSRDALSRRQYSETAVEVFEKSKILSLIPEVLDRAGVKKYLPILQDVTTQYESKPDKTASDLLFLSDLYEKLGEPEKQLRALEDAIALDPDDPRPKLLLASRLFEEGDRATAQALYRQYLFAPRRHEGQTYLFAYVAGLAYPFPVCATLVGSIWLFGALLFRRGRARLEALEEGLGKDAHGGFLRRLLPFAGALVPLLLAQRFWSSGQALPFGLLILLFLSVLGALIGPLFWRGARPVVLALRRGVTSLFSVRFARTMARVPTGWRIVMALGTLFVIVAIAPTISVDDVRYALYLLCALLFFGTIGSLLVTFLHQARSLSTSLRWIGVASTFPFLIVFVVSKWDDIGAPLMHARLPSAHAVGDLTDYLVFWGISLLLALHLSRILADALIAPVKSMMGRVSAIERGDFQARVEVVSRDEIGELASAVNRMAEGLARREFVEKTFSRYVDPKLAEKILGDPAGSEVRVAGQRMRAVVLFSDIRGFTRTSEKLKPEEVVGFLNDYFAAMVPLIREKGGVIDKFIGDAVMAVWGVPYPVEDAARKAVEAALGMRDRMAEISTKFERLGYPRLGIGIGINLGEVVAGSIGAEKLDYTVIGDVVNTAQRGEANASAQQILITESVWNEVKDFVDAEALEGRMVKGKSEPVFFWSVRGRKAAAEDAARTAQG